MIDLVPDELQSEAAAVARDALEPLGLRTSAAIPDAEWRTLASVGLFGVAEAELDGGAGMGLAGATLVAEAVGATLAPLGVLATIAAAHDEHHRARMLDGRARAAFAAPRGDGRWTVVDFVPDGALVLLDDDPVVVDATEVREVDSLDSLDEGAVLSAVRIDPAAVAATRNRPGEPGHAARLLIAAAAVGVSGQALARATGYAATRQQFGAVIGSFQAVKHRCVDMAVLHEAALSSVRFAAVRADAGIRDDVAGATAAYLAGEAARRNSASAVQVFGGIGFTAENGLHHLLHRAWLLHLLLGAPALHGERLLRAVSGAHGGEAS